MKKYTAVRVSEDTHGLLTEIKSDVEAVVPDGINYSMDALIEELIAEGRVAVVETIAARYARHEATG